MLGWWEVTITTSSRLRQILRENIENNQSKGMHTKNRLGLSRWAETCLGWDHFSSIRKLRRKFRVGANPAKSGLASKSQEPTSIHLTRAAVTYSLRVRSHCQQSTRPES